MVGYGGWLNNQLILMMEIISTTEVTQTLSSVISKIQKEPVIIRENDHEVAVIMSIEDYKRLTEANLQEFQLFRKTLAEKAKEGGLTEEKLIDALNEENLTDIYTQISEPTLNRIWDNPEDADYDNL